jgi:hypothetical protein
MSFNSKAAVAACFATLFIISGTAALAQTGGHMPAASYVSKQI